MTFINFHTHQPAWDEAVFTPSSFGIHPWDAAEAAVESYEQFCCRHKAAFEQATCVGECGLDRACNVDFEVQRTVFEYQLKLNETMLGCKTVVVHCVRAYDTLLQLRKRYPKAMWVVHGFRGGIEQALQLHRAHIGISFGAAILDERNDKLRQCLRDYPYPFMLETDTASTPIADIYAEAASIKGITIEELCQQTHHYCQTLIKNSGIWEFSDS